MKISAIFAGLGVAAAVVAFPIARQQSGVFAVAAVTDEAPAETPGFTGRMRILSPASQHSCILTRTALEGTGPVTPDGHCAQLLPVLGDVAGWEENADGSVVLTDRNGREILMLGLADGHAYESISPATAMLVVEPAF